jgi:protein-arginine kinase activator protein McsA
LEGYYICSVHRHGNNRWYPPLLGAFLILLLSIPATAAVKDEECLDCHDKLKGFSHKGAGCIDCHSSITELPHGDKLPKPDCAGCHEKAAALYKGDVHRTDGLGCVQCHDVHFLEKGRKTCASCHGAPKHSGLPARERHLGSLSCVACHGRPDGTELRVRVFIKGKKTPDAGAVDRDGNHLIDRDEWHQFEGLLEDTFRGHYSIEKRYVVRGGLHTIAAKPAACDTCHGGKGYFSDALLQVTGSTSYEIPVDPRVFIPELPKYKDFEKTVHGLNGVTCVDCHGSERKAGRGWTIDSTVCVKCHEEVSEVYGRSKHSLRGAAQCVDCHNPHSIRSYRDRPSEARVAVCARCHRNYIERHGWLPNTRLHFSYLECATCHSPRSQKSMVYYFAEKTESGKTPLSYGRLVAALGTDPDSFVKGDGHRDADARIGRLFTILRKKDTHAIIDASIIVTKVYHDYSETPAKEKGCLPCHSGEAAFYDSMFFVLPEKESTDYVPVKGTLFSSYPIGTFVDIFLLGEDKLTKADFRTFLGLKGPRLTQLGFKLIDFFGMLLMVLALAAIGAHVTLRIVKRR